jgi:hypothetical protein
MCTTTTFFIVENTGVAQISNNWHTYLGTKYQNAKIEAETYIIRWDRIVNTSWISTKRIMDAR